MKSSVFIILLIILISSCANQKYTFGEYHYYQASYEQPIVGTSVLRTVSLDPQTAEQILALDADNISAADITETLSQAPAPRIILLHGGIYPVHLSMKSFAEFLIDMGYPEEKIRAPEGGYYSISCYENSDNLTGLVAWYYEKEALRPMIIGHSQGGMQAIKILHKLANQHNTSIQPYNPLTEMREDRTYIINPFTGREQAITDVKLSYVSVAGAGGLTRLLPNQWGINGRLRSIPDSVEEFTGFYKGKDLLGGDFLGYGPMNRHKSTGTALVRNVKLPANDKHGKIPVTAVLAQNQDTRAWINQYNPAVQALEPTPVFTSPSTNILWAADVWYSIKKHWVLEAQRLLQHGKRELQS